MQRDRATAVCCAYVCAYIASTDGWKSTGIIFCSRKLWTFTKSPGNFLAEFVRMLLMWLKILVFHSVPVENISQ